MEPISLERITVLGPRLQDEVDQLREDSEEVIENHSADDIVRTILPGLYHVTAVVNYKSKNTNAAIQLMKGAEYIQTAYCASRTATAARRRWRAPLASRRTNSSLSSARSVSQV
ncbi:hypothetical protein PR003_g4513 [Phytophthora rubi]|uniref:Uncharacterized protein n=2 Tax=Phytophthora rubi TaxID=129364 RepID=A0A6A4FM16_9STRA|nr:hypothetical protein PR002_g5320 [Phytophthora rubi]KAE9352173.1 hypothetical protein PR003_g4513 [Phytophthora rubi]